MSNLHSIAAVTQALYLRLSSALTRNNLRGALLSKKPPAKNDAAAIAMVLHSVTPNVQLRNAQLPTWGPGGQRRPAVVPLELRYVLVFVDGGKPLEVQQAMGAMLADLSEKPLLTSADIEDARDTTVANDASLSKTDLHEQGETLKINPVPLDPETASRIWGTFGRSFHATLLAFQVSPLMLEGRGPAPRQPLPVLQVSLTTRATAPPVLASVSPRLSFGGLLSLQGRWDSSARLRVQVGASVFTPTRASDTELEVTLDAGAAGPQPVVVLQVDAQDQVLVSSAPQATLVAPVIQVPSAAVSDPSSVAVGLSPSASPAQQILLLLNAETGDASVVIPAAPRSAAAATAVFDCSGVAAGRYLARVSVDSVASELSFDSQRYSGPVLELSGGGS